MLTVRIPSESSAAEQEIEMNEYSIVWSTRDTCEARQHAYLGFKLSGSRLPIVTYLDPILRSIRAKTRCLKGDPN